MSKNDELLALSSVELRRRIGTKEISPVELMEAAIARMRGAQPRRQRHLRHRPTTARAARPRRRRRRRATASRSGPCTDCRPASRTCTTPKGLLTTHGSPLYRDHMPARDCAMVANVRKAGAIVVAKTNVPEFGAGANTRNPVWGATGNPFDTAAQRRADRPAARRWRWRATCSPSAPAPTPAARCASRPPIAAWSACVRRPGWCRWSCGRSAGRRSRCSDPMGRTVADVRQLFAAQIGMDDGEPLAFRAGTRAASPPGGPQTSGRLRVAWTEDFGQCPVSREIRAVMRERVAAMRHLFRVLRRGGVRLRRGGPLLRRGPGAQLRRPLPRRLHQGPELARAQRARQLRDGCGHVARRRGLGPRRADAHLPPLPGRRSATTTWCCRRRPRYRPGPGPSSISPRWRASRCATTTTGWRSPTSSRSPPIPRSRFPAGATRPACRSACR